MILLDEGMRLCLVPSPWNSDKDQKKNEENPFSFTLFKSRLEEDVERATLFAQGHCYFLEAVRAVIENTTHNRNGFHSCSFIQLQHSSLQKNAKQTQISTTNRTVSNSPTIFSSLSVRLARCNTFSSYVQLRNQRPMRLLENSILTNQIQIKNLLV